MVTIMNNKFKNLLKITSVVVAITLLSTGCTSTVPTGSDFEDVVYQMKLNTGSSETVDTQSSVNENSSNENSSALNSTETEDENSKIEENQDEQTEEEKLQDPTFVQNWPELLNPNGFNINSVQNAIKFSCVGGKITPSTFLPSVAYLENGVARDVMFNGFAFTNSVNMVGGSLTQKDWLNYIYSFEFREGFNVDALENAVGQVKTALEMPDYKAGVFLCLTAPEKSVTNWGEIDGKTLNFSESNEDRITALKWYVDEQIKAFNDRKYQNIELCGFYFYNESLGSDALNYLPEITDYVRSLKYITVWSPYYAAAGYDKWKDFGFDRAAMQANYFAGAESLPNAGGKERVTNAAAITASRGMGIEMEISGQNPNNVVGIKEYYRVGITTGFMYRWHTWWVMGDLKGIKNLYESKDPYVQSAYKEMYLFLNNRLQLADITTE